MQNVRKHLRPDLESDGAEKPDRHCSYESYLGVSE